MSIEPSNYLHCDAIALATAAGDASDFACRALATGQSPEVVKALNDLSLRFAQHAMQVLGVPAAAGKGADDEAASG